MHKQIRQTNAEAIIKEQCNKQISKAANAKLSKEASHSKSGSVERKSESSIPSGVTIVVILKIGSSMHDAKAHVHRSEVGSLYAGESEEET